MKKLCYVLMSIILMSVLLFSGCSVKTEAIPLSTSVQTGNDIKITFSANQTVYKASKINKDNLFDYEIKIEYAGEEDGITIYHSSGFVCFSMTDENGDAVMNTGINNEGSTSILKKNEPIVIKWNGSSELEEIKEFTKGIYTVTAYAPVSTTENGNDANYLLELPLIIE